MAKIAHKKLTDDVLDVLKRSSTEGNTLRLPGGQLERSLYVKVNEAIEMLGGKWNRKAKGHIFPSDPYDLIANAISDGKVVDEKKTYQFFETPEHIARQLVQMADVEDHHLILEPSAGKGRIIDQLPMAATVHVCEIHDERREYLRDNCPEIEIVGADFLAYNPGPIYDRIVANPPFSDQQDVAHVLHMYECVKPGGIVVSVLSATAMTRQTRLSDRLNGIMQTECGGYFEPLPDGAFKESDTGARTGILRLRKPSDAVAAA